MTTESILGFIIQVIAASGGAAAVVSVLNKHKQNKELEHYKSQVNALFNRITKIHEEEIKILPTAWQKLQNAHGHLARLIQPSRIERDFSQMNEAQLKGWQDEYDEISGHLKEFHDYLLYNSIFLSPDLYVEFQAIDELFRTALVKSRAAKQGLKSAELTLDVYRNIFEESEPIKERIKVLVQKRLHYQDAV